MTPEQRRVADRYGVEIVEMRSWSSAEAAVGNLQGPLYLSLDLDGLDPGFAPGVSHPEPGGLSPRQTIEILQHLDHALREGADCFPILIQFFHGLLLKSGGVHFGREDV